MDATEILQGDPRQAGTRREDRKDWDMMKIAERDEEDFFKKIMQETRKPADQCSFRCNRTAIWLGVTWVLCASLFPIHPVSGAVGDASEDRELESLLPPSTIAMLKIDGLEKLADSLEGNPLFSLWQDEDVQRFFAPLKSEWERKAWTDRFEKELGLSAEELLEHFPGEALIALTDIEFDESLDEVVQVGLLAVIEYAGEIETIKTFMNRTLTRTDEAKDSHQAVVVEDDFLGVRIFLKEEVANDERVYRDGWAFHDGLLIKAASADLLRATIARLVDGGGEDSLSVQQSFQDARERSGKANLFFFVDLSPLVEVLDRLVDQQTARAPPNMLGITPKSVFEALAFDVLEGFYLSLEVMANETSLDSGFFYREKRGLVSLFAYTNGRLPRPGYVPDDSLTVSTMRFDLEEFWNALEEIMDDISPLLTSVYGGYRQQLIANLGVDVHKLVIANVDEEIVSYSGFGADQSGSRDPTLEELSQVWVLRPKDVQGFEMAIRVLMGVIGLDEDSWEQREFLGSTIFTRAFGLAVQSSGAGAGGQSNMFSYAFTEEHLLVGMGSPRLLESALGRIDRSGDSLWENRDLDLAIRRFPGDAASFTFYDIGALLSAFFSTLARLQEQMMDSEDSFDICDPSSIPGPKEFPFFWVAKAYAEENGLFGKSLLIKKGE